MCLLSNFIGLYCDVFLIISIFSNHGLLSSGQFPIGVGNTDATFILELLHFIKKIEVLLVYKYNIINIIIKKVMLAMSCLMIGTYPIQGCG
jgi:hypothetical protein